MGRAPGGPTLSFRVKRFTLGGQVWASLTEAGDKQLWRRLGRAAREAHADLVPEHVPDLLRRGGGAALCRAYQARRRGPEGAPDRVVKLPNLPKLNDIAKCVTGDAPAALLKPGEMSDLEPEDKTSHVVLLSER